MAWVRLEDDFTDNAKIAELSDRDFRAWVRLLCYCGRAKDPTVDAKTRREVAGLTPTRVSRFISLGLLDEYGASPGAFEVHDWLKYQPKDATSAERQSRFRSRKQAKDAVTPPVMEPVSETVTPSHAGVTDPSRTEEQRQRQEGLLTANRSALPVVSSLPVNNELEILRLLSFVGEQGDEAKTAATQGTIRGLARRLSEGSLAKVLESALSRNGEIEDRAAYIVGALKSEIREREKVTA